MLSTLRVKRFKEVESLKSDYICVLCLRIDYVSTNFPSKGHVFEGASIRGGLIIRVNMMLRLNTHKEKI